LERKYVVEKNGYLFAQKLGFRVIKELENSTYKKFVEEEFTANLEKIMDEVEAGKMDYKEVLENLYEEILKIDN
jgi:reverse gyrase